MTDFAPLHYFTAAQPFRTPGAVVSEGTAIGLPPLWKGLHIVAHGLAVQAPLETYVGQDLVGSLPFVSRPNPRYTNYNFWFEATTTAILWGNWFGIVIRDLNGLPLAVEPVHPQYVSKVYRSNLLVAWQVGTSTIALEDMLHVRGFTLPNQLEGIGILEAHKRGIGLALDTMTYASAQYRGHGVPSVVVKFTGEEPTQESADDFREGWDTQFGNNRGGTAIVGPDTEIVNLQVPTPEQMETMAARSYGASEMAWLLGLDPTDLGVSPGTSSGTMTYANLLDRKAARNADAISPWTERFQQAFDDLVPGDATVRFQVEKLLSLDEPQRIDLDLKQVAAGVMTIDEYRAKRGWSPLSIEPAPAAPIESNEAA